MNLKNKEDLLKTRRIEDLLKTRRILEQRLHNFERRNNNLEGNFVGQIINLKRRIREIDSQIIKKITKPFSKSILEIFESYWEEEK